MRNHIFTVLLENKYKKESTIFFTVLARKRRLAVKTAKRMAALVYGGTRRWVTASVKRGGVRGDFGTVQWECISTTELIFHVRDVSGKNSNV